MAQTVYINCNDAGDAWPTDNSAATAAANTFKTWNNIHQVEAGPKTLDLPNGSSSGWSITQTAFTEDNLGSDLGELTVSGDASWIDEQIISEHMIVSGRTGFFEGTPVTFEISGLTNGNTYWVEVFSSRLTATNDRITEFFTDAAATVSVGTLDAKANQSNTLTWSDTAASGKIIITFESREENTPSGECYGYLNAFRVSDNATFADGATNELSMGGVIVLP